MGSWSMYCGISKITIASGMPMVIIPIKQARGNGIDTYFSHTPAALPIFGEYDDYGGIEGIIEDENTKAIAEHFGITIEEFCYALLHRKYDRDDAVKPTKNLEEFEKMNFMLVHGDVYKVMSSYADNYEKGNLDFGRPEILTLLGFTKVEGEINTTETYDPKRFEEIWELNGKRIYSDGQTAAFPSSKGGSFVMYFKDPQYGLSDYYDIAEDKMYIGQLTMSDLWQCMSKELQAEEFGYVIGVSRYQNPYQNTLVFSMTEIMVKVRDEAIVAANGDETLIKEANDKFGKYIDEDGKRTKELFTKLGIAGTYLLEFERFGDMICKLRYFMSNLHCMSGNFDPYVHYITPQCGEFKQHQYFLDKFAEINRNILKEYGYDEEEEESEEEAQQ